MTTTSRPAESGLVICDKPTGWTSHQVVGRVRRLLGTRKVGHAGTLDPMATGVLVVGVNRATRLLGLLALDDKAYAATIRLGLSTITDDAEGEVTATPGAAGVVAAALAGAMAELTGDIAQVPSAVSAIKIDGVRSYARVRAGHEVVLAARPVRVRRFDVIARRDTVADGVPVVDLDVQVECSTGTYVRALARDLGAALGTGGHLTALRRLRSGPVHDYGGSALGRRPAAPATPTRRGPPLLPGPGTGRGRGRRGAVRPAAAGAGPAGRPDRALRPVGGVPGPLSTATR